MSDKDIPVRKTRIAEDYAKKVRMEPPKASRQEKPLAATGKNTVRNQKLLKSSGRQENDGTDR